MKVAGKVVVVTGAANGIGEALARRFATDGAAAVVVADRDADRLDAVARSIGALAVPCDVTDPEQVEALVETAWRDAGPVDLFCSNAGIFVFGGVEVADDQWRRILDVNVMAHIWAARALLPRMIERGGGYLLQTASAAGLLTQLGSAPYSITKHAAVALAEWISITHAEQGIKVSVLCPQAVATNMTAGIPSGGVAGVDGMLAPEQVADAVVEGLADERFLILPHPEVAEYFHRKGDDYERWIRGMRRLQARFAIPPPAAGGGAAL